LDQFSGRQERRANALQCNATQSQGVCNADADADAGCIRREQSQGTSQGTCRKHGLACYGSVSLSFLLARSLALRPAPSPAGSPPRRLEYSVFRTSGGTPYLFMSFFFISAWTSLSQLGPARLGRARRPSKYLAR